MKKKPNRTFLFAGIGFVILAHVNAFTGGIQGFDVICALLCLIYHDHLERTSE